LYDGTSLQQTAGVDLKDDADNVRYDKASRRFWVGYGEGGLVAIDAESGKQVADIKLDAYPEAFQLETNGKRIFVNLPNAGYVAVVDREAGTVIEKIPLKEASANSFPSGWWTIALPPCRGVQVSNELPNRFRARAFLASGDLRPAKRIESRALL
jgi:hypothetical protein